jgi:hypothetical protein
MLPARRTRVAAVAAAALALLLALSLPASAAGPKRIFITKYDENFMGQAGVTFELYQDTDGDGVLDPGEPKLQSKVTDAAGNATFDPVNPGKYIVHEVTPAGYVDNPDKAVEIPNARGKGPTIVFSNTPQPEDHRVNDPSSDASFGDGTHIFDFGPSIAVNPSDPSEVLVAWNRSAAFASTGTSFVQTALSKDGGNKWGNYSTMPSGSPSTFILGEPSVVYDPLRNRFVLAADAITATGSGLLNDIVVSTSGGPSGFWNTPVHIPGIPLQPAIAHGPRILVDPKTGNVTVLYTQSNADGTSQPMVSTSTDGGKTWTTPNPIAGPGKHFDFVDGVFANGRLNVAFGEYGSPDTFDVMFDRSKDPRSSWGANRMVAGSLARSGTPGGCGSTGERSLLGRFRAKDRVSIVADPTDPSGKRFYVTTTVQGPPGDESDVGVHVTSDGGKN